MRRGVAWLTACAALSSAPVPALDAAREAELLRLLRNDCGACHGLTLRGGLGLPLTPPALAGKPDALLIDAILVGRPGTPMPPWQAFLTAQDAAWLVERMRRGGFDE